MKTSDDSEAADVRIDPLIILKYFEVGLAHLKRQRENEDDWEAEAIRQLAKTVQDYDDVDETITKAKG
jgi:hypothetical protein